MWKINFKTHILLRDKKIRYNKYKGRESSQIDRVRLVAARPVCDGGLSPFYFIYQFFSLFYLLN